jgi:hypothetical protein
MSIEAKKINVVQLILSIDNEDVIDKISAELIQMIPQAKDVDDNLLLARYAGKIEEKLDLDKIMKEQNYSGIEIEKMDRLAKEANIEESIEDLLEMLD